jgi:hypothetical protein
VARSRSQPARHVKPARLGWPVRLFATGPVGGALILSFANLADLARASRIEGWLAYLWPVTLDATGVVATLIWLNPGMPDGARRSAMRLALAAITVSILGNSLMHWLLDNGQRPHVIIQMIVAAVPPSVLFMMLHVLHLALARPEQPAGQEPASVPDDAATSQPEPARAGLADGTETAGHRPGTDVTPTPDPMVVATAARTDQGSQPDQIGPASPASQTHLAIPAGSHTTSQPASRRWGAWRDHIEAARPIVAGQPDIGRVALAERLGIPDSQARKVLNHLATAPAAPQGQED